MKLSELCLHRNTNAYSTGAQHIYTILTALLIVKVIVNKPYVIDQSYFFVTIIDKLGDKVHNENGRWWDGYNSSSF